MAIVIRTYVVCDKCKTEFLGHSTQVGTPQRTNTRVKANENGWDCNTHIRWRKGMSDLCPNCKGGDAIA